MRWRARCPRRARGTPLWRCQTGATWRCSAAATRTATCFTAASPSSTPPPGAGPPPRSRSAPASSPAHQAHEQKFPRIQNLYLRIQSTVHTQPLFKRPRCDNLHSSGEHQSWSVVVLVGCADALRLEPSIEQDMFSSVSAAHAAECSCVRLMCMEASLVRFILSSKHFVKPIARYRGWRGRAGEVGMPARCFVWAAAAALLSCTAAAPPATSSSKTPGCLSCMPDAPKLMHPDCSYMTRKCPGDIA